MKINEISFLLLEVISLEAPHKLVEAEVEVENGGCKKLFVAHKVATETTYIDHKW